MPLLSLYGIIYVTWYTSNLPEATGVRLRLPNSHALLGSGMHWKTPLLTQSVNQLLSDYQLLLTFSLEDEGTVLLFYTVLYMTVVTTHTHMYEQFLQSAVGLGLHSAKRL